jgi:hypothetical protein
VRGSTRKRGSAAAIDDAEGRPQTVVYQALATLLLHELKQVHAQAQADHERLEAALASQARADTRIGALESAAKDLDGIRAELKALGIGHPALVAALAERTGGAQADLAR